MQCDQCAVRAGAVTDDIIDRLNRNMARFNEMFEGGRDAQACAVWLAGGDPGRLAGPDRGSVAVCDLSIPVSRRGGQLRARRTSTAMET